MHDSILETSKKTHLIKSLFLGFFFCAFLSCFLHFHEVKKEMGELHTVAPKYLFSETDFAFFDKEATVKLRTAAAEEIGAIYKIDEKELRVKCKELMEAFAEKGVPVEQLSETIAAIEAFLCNSRFADEHTLAKIKDIEKEGSSSVSSYLFHSLILPQEFWQEIEAKVKDGEFAETILSFFKNHMDALRIHAEKDFILERALRQIVQDAISPQITHMKAGQPLIHPGEKVTRRHLTMEKAMQMEQKKKQHSFELLPFLGNGLLALFFSSLIFFYFRSQHRDILNSLRKTSLVGIIVVATLLLSKAAELFFLHQGDSLHFYFKYPIIVPFASLLSCILIGWEVSLFLSAILTVIIGRSLAVDFSHFLVMNLMVSFVMIFFTRNIHRRRAVFAVGAKGFIASMLVLFAFHLIDNSLWNQQMARDTLSSLAFLFSISLLAVALLPLFESLFQVTTDMTLMEHMDPDNPLLRRLSLEAPGTYQHSLVVGNLAETAARSIGANGLFCRVAALYHDIGKLFNPHYFTENQLGGFNIHQLLTPQESAQVIISHVKEGENLLRKNRLPQTFIDIAKEHHGTSLVYYFYCKHLELEGNDPQKTKMANFRYEGPKPKTKESAIIMIADCVEAASRSLDEYSEKNLIDLVDKLVAERNRDGQLDDCQLTFEELGKVKKSMVKTLLVSGHMRIKYPSKAP